MKKIVISLMIGIIIGGIYACTQMVREAIPTNLQISSQKDSNNEIVNNEYLLKNRNQGNYMIIEDENTYRFEEFYQALKFIRLNEFNKIYFQDKKRLIWKNNTTLKDKVVLDIPHLQQYPELARGCEVTSLTMMLNYYGYKVDKMELAEKVKKDKTPYMVKKDGKIQYGNPYDGFVGDIYNINNNGYGVYHGPMTELAKEYAGEDVIDLTGIEFEDLLYFMDKEIPIWIVTNATFKELEENAFEIWHTPTGIVKITKRMHSVVITGYDKDYIYVNDPLYTRANRKLNKKDFKEAWEQMGRQAIVIMK